VAEHSVISVVLSASTTADLNFMTPYEIVSFYPRCTLANECMPMTKEPLTEEQVSILEGQGVTIITTNEHWTKTCGWYCPMRMEWCPPFFRAFALY
jgi:hypothetical protein